MGSAHSSAAPPSTSRITVDTFTQNQKALRTLLYFPAPKQKPHTG